MLLIFFAGLVAGIALAIAMWAVANTHAAQRAFPGVGAWPWVRDRGYRVFRMLLDGPSEKRIELADECRRMADAIRGTLNDPLPRACLLTPEKRRLLLCTTRHSWGVRVLLGRACEAGAIHRNLVPIGQEFPVVVDDLPRFFDEIAHRLETGLRLRKVSRALGREIPASTQFVYLAN